jgi:osmotically-inducible protein OsmY
MSKGDEGPFSRSGAAGHGHHSLDAQVCEALTANAAVDASQIGVAVDAATGDLILFGTVSTHEQLRLAEDCAASVRGVNVVYNRLTVASNDKHDSLEVGGKDEQGSN